MVTPRLQRGQRVGQRLAVGVVEVHGELAELDAGAEQAPSSAATCPGVATPMVSPRLSSVQPERQQRAGDRDDLVDAGRRPPTGRRSTSTGSRARRALAPGPVDDRGEHRERLGDACG